MRGFDFLGYHFKPGMVCVAEKSVHNFKKYIDRLYEQGAGLSHIGQYVKKWVQWVNAGDIIEHLTQFKIYFEKGWEPPHLGIPRGLRLPIALLRCDKVCFSRHGLITIICHETVQIIVRSFPDRPNPKRERERHSQFQREHLSTGRCHYPSITLSGLFRV